jgi:hypothetical protein
VAKTETRQKGVPPCLRRSGYAQAGIRFSLAFLPDLCTFSRASEALASFYKFFLAKCFVIGYVYKSQGRSKALDFILLVDRTDKLIAGTQG